MATVVRLRNFRTVPPFATALLAIATFSTWGGILPGQPAAAQESSDLTLPTNRTVKFKLDQVPQLLEKRLFNDVTRFLGEILGGGDQDTEDAFYVVDDARQNPKGLKAEARRLLGELPEDGRKAYQLQFGARARKLLDEALDSGQVGRLEEISRRFFHTDAGYEATLLLGQHHLDHGHPLAAAFTYQQLQNAKFAARQFEPMLSLRAAVCWYRAGMPEKAKQTLLRLKQQQPKAILQVRGEDVRLFAQDQDALPWLQKIAGPPPQGSEAASDLWTMYRGDASRNGQSTGGSPLFATRWRVRTVNDPSIERILTGIQQVYADQKKVALLPALHPLAVGNLIVTRSARNLVGIDFESGKRVWETRPLPKLEDSIDRLIKTSHNRAADSEKTQLVKGLEARMWDDFTYGTLSSDGERVYAIQDLQLVLNEYYEPGVIFGGQVETESSTRTFNRLSAIELNRSEGKLAWDVGGPDSVVPELGEAFFLGAPLPVGGQLFVLAEIKGGIRLVVLDAKTGRLEWSQQLADLEQNIAQNWRRRLAGASPSFSDGVLICPTSAGAVVAIDVMTRSLLWAQQYKGRDREHGLLGPGVFRYNSRDTERDNSRWIDSSATIADGRVILTPVESNQLHCLNLLDGSKAWGPQSRGDNLYVACVHQGKIILVGKRHVTAISLADGSQAWERGMLPLPPDGLPSGRGFHHGNSYYLPLSSAEVARIDLDEGKIVERVKSRDGHVPGNLICYRGMVISQGADFVYKYFQLEPLEQWIAATLKSNPEHPEALLRSGQLAVERGTGNDAIEFFRRAYRGAAKAAAAGNDAAAQAPSSVLLEARELLVKSLLEGLRTDFAAHRESLGDVDGLIDQPELRQDYLRLKAAGLQQAGEIGPALASYLELIDLDEGGDNELESIAPHHRVRRDRWVQAQLAAVYAAADAEQKQRMDAAYAERLQGLAGQESEAKLRRLLGYFGRHPLTDEHRLHLADLLLADGKYLECQLLLTELERGVGSGEWGVGRQRLLTELERASQAERRGAAVARLARLYASSGQPEQARLQYRRLREEFADVVCLDGKTGRELVAALPAEQRLLAADSSAVGRWPLTEIEATLRGNGEMRLYQQSRPLPMRGSAGLAPEMTIALDQQPPTIIGYDRQGAARFRIPLHPPNIESPDYDVDPNTSYGAVRGNLLLVSRGDEIVAVDTLNLRNAGWQNVLWKANLTELAPGIGSSRTIMHSRTVRVTGGLGYMRAEDGRGHPVGLLGPITSQGFTYQRGRELICVHPLTGETLWSRRNMPLGCELIGDEEVLLAIEPGTTKATVLRAVNGTTIGTCTVPTESQRVAVLGRRVLSFSTTAETLTLTLADLWSPAALASPAATKPAASGEEDKEEKDTEEKGKDAVVANPRPAGEIWRREFARYSKLWCIENDELAVLEPSGKFTIVKLANGQPVVTAQVEAIQPADMYVLRSQDQYHLIYGRSPVTDEVGLGLSAIPGDAQDPSMITGLVYAFDRRTGKMQWHVPANIEQRGLKLPQPAGLPVLVFMHNVTRRAGRGDERFSTAVLCLDKRTGHAMYRNDTIRVSDRPTLDYRVEGDLARKTITLHLSSAVIQLTYTDQPLPPEPADQVQQVMTRKKGKGLFGILKAIPKAIGRAAGEDDNLFGEPAEEMDDDEGTAPGPEDEESDNDVPRLEDFDDDTPEEDGAEKQEEGPEEPSDEIKFGVPDEPDVPLPKLESEKPRQPRKDVNEE